MRDIRAFARRVAREFKPQRIILFGSYGYGCPSEDSDVDLLVVMRYRGHPVHKAVEIVCGVKPTFPLDLLVRSPRELVRRYELEDWFMREIVDRGKVLYEARNARMGRKGRGRLRNSAARAAGAKGA